MEWWIANPSFPPKCDNTNGTANDEDPVEKDTLYANLNIKLLPVSNQTWPSSSLFRRPAKPREFFKAPRNENNLIFNRGLERSRQWQYTEPCSDMHQSDVKILSIVCIAHSYDHSGENNSDQEELAKVCIASK